MNPFTLIEDLLSHIICARQPLRCFPKQND